MITFISDEVSPDLSQCLRFAQDNGLTQIELRSIGGTNLMDLELEQVRQIAQTIHRTGLTVANLSSPLLKWLPPGKVAQTGEVNFHGYQLSTEAVDQVFEKAFLIADILQTASIRIFSYLKYEGFQGEDLAQDMQTLLQLAERYDKTLLLENEPVCNINTLPQQIAFLTQWNHPRLRALLDIGNLYQSGCDVQATDLLKLAPYLEYAHIKDFSSEQGCYVPLGEGSIPYQEHLSVLHQGLQSKVIPFSLETHVKVGPEQATQVSLQQLRLLLSDNFLLEGMK